MSFLTDEQKKDDHPGKTLHDITVESPLSMFSSFLLVASFLQTRGNVEMTTYSFIELTYWADWILKHHA